MLFPSHGPFLDVDIELAKAGIVIGTAAGTQIELTFSDLRKHSIEEVFDIRADDNLLAIKEKVWRKPILGNTFLNQEINIDLILKIPAGSQLRGRIATISGDIEADMIQFNGKMKTISGKMAFGTVQSSGLHLQNIGGNVQIDHLNGSVSARIVSGTCWIKKGRIDHLALTSVSGDILVNADFEFKKESSISTVSGDISLGIASYLGNHKLIVSSLSGRTAIEGNYPHDSVEIQKRLPFLKNHPFKSFLPLVKKVVTSFTSLAEAGDVEVQAKEDEALEPHIQRILDMLSEGKISAAEAEKLINAIKT